MDKRERVSLLALSYQEASRLSSEGLDRELTSRELWALWIHTRLCAYCRRFANQLKQIRTWIQTLPKQDRDQNLGQATRLSSTRRREIERLLREAMKSGGSS